MNYHHCDTHVFTHDKDIFHVVNPPPPPRLTLESMRSRVIQYPPWKLCVHSGVRLETRLL